MITDYPTRDDTTGYEADAERQIIWAFTPDTTRKEVTAGSISVYLDPTGYSGTQRVTGVIGCLNNGVLTKEVTEEIEVVGGDAPGWYTLRVSEPLQGPVAAGWTAGLHFDAPPVTEWRGDAADLSAVFVDEAYAYGWDNYTGDMTGDPLAKPLAFVDLLPVPAAPTEPDDYYARLGFNSAQSVLGVPGPEAPRYQAVVGWHGTYLDSESQGASFAIVQTGGALADLIGERVKVTYGHRSVVAYVHRTLDLDSGEEISLSRRAFQSLANLATDSLTARVEALGPEG
jgi:hypothetical protein